MAAAPLTRRLLPLSLIFIVVGPGTSFVGAYLALFLTEGVHAGQLRTTTFLIVTPIAGVAASWLIGRASDRRPIRRQLPITAALAGAVGALLTAVLRATDRPAGTGDFSGLGPAYHP